MQLERSARDDAGFARAILVGKTELGGGCGAVSAVSTNTLRDVARGPATAAEIGSGERNVKSADIGARVREAGCAVGEAIQAHVPSQRLSIELSLKATQALAGRVQTQSVALEQSHIKGEVLGQAYGLVDLLQASDFLPLTIRLQEQPPTGRRPTDREAGLPCGTRTGAAILRGGDGTDLFRRNYRGYSLQWVYDLKCRHLHSQSRNRRFVVAPARDDGFADPAGKLTLYRLRHVNRSMNEWIRPIHEGGRDPGAGQVGGCLVENGYLGGPLMSGWPRRQRNVELEVGRVDVGDRLRQRITIDGKQ